MAQLLDAYGRPIRTAELKREVARPSIAGVRSAWADSVAAGLTPARLASILQGAAEGEPRDYLALAEEMEERDPHYASVLGTRKRVISGLQPTVEAASEDARDVEIAEAVSRAIADHDGWSELVEDLLDGLGKGFSVVEIDWETTERQWRPRRFLHRDPRWFRFDRETGRALRLLTDGDAEGEPLAPAKFLAMTAKLKSGLPLRGGLARLVAFGWLCKQYALKDWIAFVECYGFPLRLGRYGPEATKDDVRILHTAVASIGSDAAAVLPRSMEIEFQELASNARSDTFEKLAQWIDKQTSKAVLGQTMSADDGASLAQAKVHDDVRLDIAQADARAVGAVIARDLIRPFVDLNWGAPANGYPLLRIHVPEPEDTKLLMESVGKLAPLGVRFAASELRAKLGLRDPEGDEETIGAAPQPAPPPAAPPAETARRIARLIELARAEPAEPADPWSALDPIEAAAALDWERQLGPMIEPIEALAAEVEAAGGGYAEFRARLPELLERMEVGPLIDGLVGAMFQARAMGDVRDV